MPQRSKGPRLWLRPERRDSKGKRTHESSYIILDGKRQVGTGCGPRDREAAERELSKYISSKHTPRHEHKRHPTEIRIGDVVNMYLQDVAPGHARPEETAQRCVTLLDFWGNMLLSEVCGATCRAYVQHRTSQSWKSSHEERTGRPARKVSRAAARRELEDFRAAINYHRKEGQCSEVVAVVLPPKTAPRERWLTREEAARLLWAAWRARQRTHGNRTERDVGKHVARFILVGLKTGSRAGAICEAALGPAVGRGYVDLERGVFYRRAPGTRDTKKRRPRVPLPERLLVHLRRWKRLGISRHAIVEWNDRPVKSIRKAFRAAVDAAGLGSDVTPHVLRHTAATWLMQAGADPWSVAGYLGMTVQQLEATYGHHHPDHLAKAVRAFDEPPKLRQRLAGTKPEHSGEIHLEEPRRTVNE